MLYAYPDDDMVDDGDDAWSGTINKVATLTK